MSQPQSKPAEALESWRQQVADLLNRPDLLQLRLRDVRSAGLGLADKLPADFDSICAELWRSTDGGGRRLVLLPLLEGHVFGKALTQAMLTSVEGRDERSANTALALLEERADIDPEGWRRIGRVARAQRQALLPDIDAVQLLAKGGPAEALPTVALTAFRRGPEDADDRLTAIAGLGRFDDPRILPWLRTLARTGSVGLEVLQAAAQLMARDPASPGLADLLVELASNEAGLDALLRWSALDGLCHLQGAEALPALLAAHQAAGQDLPEWYLPALAGRAMALEPSLAKGDPSALRQAAAALQVPTWPAVPGLNQRALSRDARVARQAAFEQPGPSAEVLRHRAGVEAALVARQQLVGSLLPEAPAAAVPAHFGANWAGIAEDERGQLLSQEAVWLADGR